LFVKTEVKNLSSLANMHEDSTLVSYAGYFVELLSILMILQSLLLLTSHKITATSSN